MVRRLLPQVPLSRLYQALRAGEIRVNGARVAPDTRTRAADLISVCATVAPDIAAPAPEPELAGPAAADPPPAVPPILFRGGGVVVVDKPAGLPVHGRGDSVLARLLPAIAPPAADAALSFTPGPVHQLDRMTSGTLVIAETLAAARQWSAALHAGSTLKLYLAVVEGKLRPAASLPAGGGPAHGLPTGRGPAGGVLWADTLAYDRRWARAIRVRGAGDGKRTGKPACAHVWPLATSAGERSANGPLTLLLVRLDTGRRHQIRVQAALRGHPLLGDRRYGGRLPARPPAERPAPPGAGRLPLPLLHAAAIRNDRLALAEPVLAPLPAAARRFIDRRFGTGTARRAEAAVRALVEATHAYPEAKLAHAEATHVRAEATLAHSDATLVHDETTLARGDTTRAHAETTHAHGDTTLARAAARPTPGETVRTHAAEPAQER